VNCTRHRWPARATRAAAGSLFVVLALAAGTRAVQAAPPVAAADGPPAEPGLPAPPGDGPPGVLDEPPPEIQLTEEERHALRMREFKDHLERAEIAMERERYDEAVREYSAALRLIPGDPDALLGRAQARKLREPPGRCPTKALADLLDLGKEDPKGQWPAQRATAIEWMGECGSRFARRRLALARELAEDTGSAGRPEDIRVTVARLLEEAGEAEDKTPTERGELRKAALSELEKYVDECKQADLDPTAAGLRLIADLYRDGDDLEKAAKAYERLAELHPQAPEAKDAKSLFEDLQFELELQKLQATRGFRPTDEAQAAYNRGVAARRAGRIDEAIAEFTKAVEESRWFAQAYHARGDAYARQGEFSSAVDDLKRAVRLDRSNYAAHIALGTIYMREFAAQDEAAIEALSTAVRLRPDLYQLHLLLGELYARSDRQKAREHYRRFISEAPLDDPDSRKAREALEELEREIRQEEPPMVEPPAEEALLFLDPELQRMINEAYLRGTEYDDWGAAEKILLEARDKFPKEPIVLNELARVVYHQERPGDARQYWEESLAMKEDQVEVHERLGLLLRSQLPDEAIVHLRRAADLGSLTARFAVAELLWDQTQPIEASEQLDRYLSEANDYDLYWDRAHRLRDEIDHYFRLFYAFAGVLLFLAIAIPTWRVWRHYRGASLRQLLERDPKSFPEVARILSLIRHEILKHNTAFLADVGRALEVDAPDAEQRVAVLSRRLFGDGDTTSDGRGGTELDGGREGIYGRFYGYLDELEKVGRAHRVTLNLRRKDPIFRPMIQAFDELAGAASRLRKVDALRGRKRLELAKLLGRSGEVLGRQAFERLSGLIRELCVTNVDARLIQAVYQDVVGEKQFAGREIAPLLVSGDGAPVRIFRTDLEDILTNVFRNSLRSSVLYAPPPVGISVELCTEIDDITGLGSIAIRIKDRSPEQLSNEMLRGRYVERGMGITVDLLSRYDGSIGVEPEPGWSKAVVLRFFILEDDTVSIAAEAAQ
jgi:tetratricopeptide (TPR) repeat protein